MKKKPSNFLTPQKEEIDIVDVVRKIRNNLIFDLLDEGKLISYLSDYSGKCDLVIPLTVDPPVL